MTVEATVPLSMFPGAKRAYLSPTTPEGKVPDIGALRGQLKHILASCSDKVQGLLATNPQEALYFSKLTLRLAVAAAALAAATIACGQLGIDPAPVPVSPPASPPCNNGFWTAKDTSQKKNPDPNSENALVFAGDCFGAGINRDIYVVNGDGSIIPISASQNDESDPSWHPNGKMIVFVENISGNPQIIVLDIATGKRIQITSDIYDKSAPSFEGIFNKQSVTVTYTCAGGNVVLQFQNQAAGDNKMYEKYECRVLNPSIPVFPLGPTPTPQSSKPPFKGRMSHKQQAFAHRGYRN